MADEMRLINANAMRQDWLENGENEYVYDTNSVLDSIDAQPTVNAVEVVRCKDCIYSTAEDNELYCYGPIGIYGTVGFNDFCSCGERKDNGK